MKIYTYLFLTVATFLLTQCEVERYGCTDPNAPEYDVAADIDDGSCYSTDPALYTNCSSYSEGNLVITNQTGETLYLYKDYTGDVAGVGLDDYVTCIPQDAENFLVHIPNQSLSIQRLQIWKATDVPDRENPDLMNVYRQWSVALSNTSSSDERANWLITDDDQYGGSGTLIISYPEIDGQGYQVIYQVDVFVNSKTGAKLASLQPGVDAKKVSVDYGIHYLYFHYWYSDPNSTTGEIVEIGWEEHAEVVVNDQHRERDIEIPVYYSTVGKYGELKVKNMNDFAVNVYANDKLIEDVAVVDGSTVGLSAVPAGEESVFLIPIDKYTISLDNSKGDLVEEFAGVDVVQNEVAVITSGVGTRSISITNLTDETLGLFSQAEEYLGLVCEPGKTTQKFSVPANMDTLLVINFTKTQSAKFAYSSTATISSLEDYDYNYIEVTTVWPLIEGMYQSPVISDEEETSMEATVYVSEPAVLSFDYNVSSEEGYDYFSFFVGGITEISAVSGESGWVNFSMVLDVGTHVLKWTYTKDQTQKQGRDNVQIRNITID